MKLKYWILTLAVAVVVAAGGMAISQETQFGGETQTVTPETAPTILLAACFAPTATGGKNVLTTLNFMSVTTTTGNASSCPSGTKRIIVSGLQE